MLAATKDAFGGRVVLVEDIKDAYSPDSCANFAIDLQHSLEVWREEEVKGIWLHIPSTHTPLLAPAIKEGFELHHTEPDRVVTCYWLPSERGEKSLLPGHTTHTVGIGAVVVHEGNILAVQERTGPASESAGAKGFWKYVTGLAEGGEDIAEAAIREVKEETGVDSEVISMLAMREGHTRATTNLFYVFLMRPVAGASTDLSNLQATEIADATWFVFAKAAPYSSLNRRTPAI
jgi:ADP-ribose pyrophosphatase YjhB (NUDIX family)